MFDLYCKTLNTKTFQVTDSEVPPTDIICSLCQDGKESVMHILKRCAKLLKHSYLQGHNQVLKMFLLIDQSPPWFTKSNPKPYYENDDAYVWWDIPEFSDANTDDEDKVYRPDGKLKLLYDKIIYLIEITISWIDKGIGYGYIT